MSVQTYTHSTINKPLIVQGGNPKIVNIDWYPSINGGTFEVLVEFDDDDSEDLTGYHLVVEWPNVGSRKDYNFVRTVHQTNGIVRHIYVKVEKLVRSEEQKTAIDKLSTAICELVEMAGGVSAFQDPEEIDWLDVLKEYAPEKAERLTNPSRSKWQAYLDAMLSKRMSPPECHIIRYLDSLRLTIPVTANAKVVLFDQAEDESGFEVWIEMEEGQPKLNTDFVVRLPDQRPEGYKKVATCKDGSAVTLYSN